MHWENIHIHVYYAKHVVILYKTNTKCRPFKTYNYEINIHMKSYIQH